MDRQVYLPSLISAGLGALAGGYTGYTDEDLPKNNKIYNTLVGTLSGLKIGAGIGALGSNILLDAKIPNYVAPLLIGSAIGNYEGYKNYGLTGGFIGSGIGALAGVGSSLVPRAFQSISGQPVKIFDGV